MNTSQGRMRPIIGVLSNTVMDGDLSIQSVDDKYCHPLGDLADATVLIIPATDLAEQIDDVLDLLDGVMLTGAVSNVHPMHFGGEGDESKYLPFDLGRDAVALPLIKRVLQRNMPLLAICRGMQELNVCRNGTLAPAIQDDPLRHNHVTLDKNLSTEQRYGPAHEVSINAAGLLSNILNGATSAQVNSLHVQAVERLGDGLQVEARAHDGTVEAISVPDCSFALGVQWHPEFSAQDNAVSSQIFRAFGTAARRYAKDKL